jgi:RNA polymerase sigma-70 factor (ECF subfamily)
VKELDDNTLAKLAAKGDIDAFNELYRRHNLYPYKVALIILKNPVDAEDAAQDTFLDAFKYLHSFRGDSQFKSWLCSIAIEKAWKNIRKRDRLPIVEIDDEETFKIANAKTSTSILDAIVIQDILQRLPRGYRAVLILHDVEGYKHPQIAELLGCTEGTSRSQLHKARLKFRALLSSDDKSRRLCH